MSEIIDSALNLKYYQAFYEFDKADGIFSELKDYPFHPITFKFLNKKFTPLRKCCAFGDYGLTYDFSGTAVAAEPWTPLLLEIKEKVQILCGSTFNYCLLNLYPDGNAKISPHRDNESSLNPDAPIPTLSFGAERTMCFERPGQFASILSYMEIPYNVSASISA